MTDFPRGWMQNAISSTGVQATINVPALPGVVHVLDSFDFRMVNNGAGAGAANFVNIGLGGPSIWQSFMVLPATTAGSDEISFSGFDLATGPGGVIVLQFVGSPGAGVTQIITAQGHDV